MSFAADNIAERSTVDTFNQFNKRGAITDLESYIKTQLSFRALTDFDHLFRAGHIDSDGFFEIHMLSRLDHSFEMPRVIVRRRSHYDCVDLLGGRNLLVGVGAKEELRSV